MHVSPSPGHAALILVLCIFTLSTYAESFYGQAPLVAWDGSDECGIGFDLNPTYGASAIACANGTSAPLDILLGSDDYKSLMFRLMLPLQNPNAPTEREKIRILGHMLENLRQNSERRLGRRIWYAGATVPYTIGLGMYVGDRAIRGAFAAAGLHYIGLIWHQYTGEPVTLPVNSVSAGHGLGLCQSYNSIDPDCLQEHPLPSISYMLIGYYSDGFEVALTLDTESAYVIYSHMVADYHLGSNMMHVNPDEKYYWEKIKDVLNRLFAESLRYKPEKVICYGDGCGIEQLRYVVDEVLDRFLGSDNHPSWIEDGVDPSFAGAQGTAELVLRKPYRRY